MIVNLTMCKTRMVNACSLRARSHYQTMTRAAAVRNTGTSVRPTDASHTRPARTASDLTAVDDTTVRAYRATDSSSGYLSSLSRSHSRGSSRRGITNDLDSRRARFVCRAMGDPGSERRTLESSRHSPVSRGSSLELGMLLSRRLRGGCAVQVSRSGRGGGIEMCLSTRTRKSSVFKMRMNEWIKEGDSGSYGFCLVLVPDGILCTPLDFFFVVFILLSSYRHVLIHNLVFFALFAIEPLYDKGERRGVL